MVYSILNFEQTLKTVAGSEKTQKVLDYNVTTDPNTKAVSV